MKPTQQYLDLEGRFNRWVKSLDKPLDAETEKWLRERAVQTTLAGDFAFYVERHGWEPELVEQFRAMRNLRNGISHGDIVALPNTEADGVQWLLRRLLAAELEILTEPPQSHYPNVRGITIGFQYVTSTDCEGLADDHSHSATEDAQQ